VVGGKGVAAFRGAIAQQRPTEAQTHLLHDVIGKVYVVPESSDVPSDDETEDGEAGSSDSGSQITEESGQSATAVSDSSVPRRRTRRASSLH